MSKLKELTWEHHKNAERHKFAKLLMSGKMPKELYATYLYNQHPCYDVLEVIGMVHGLMNQDLRRAPAIWEDFRELWTENTDDPNFKKPFVAPVVKEFIDHIKSIKDDKQKIMAHIYVRHMADLSGGQMIRKRIPGSGKLYDFPKPIEEMKADIRKNLNDDMKDEAIIAFEFATKLFKELSTQIYDEDNRDTTNDPFKGTVIEGKD